MDMTRALSGLSCLDFLLDLWRNLDGRREYDAKRHRSRPPQKVERLLGELTKKISAPAEPRMRSPSLEKQNFERRSGS
jgi:hypothetical protein